MAHIVRRPKKKSTLAAAVAKLAQRVDTIESNAVRDHTDDASLRRKELSAISDRLERMDRSMNSGFALIADQLMVANRQLQTDLAEYKRANDERTAALEARLNGTDFVVSAHERRLTAIETQKELTP